MYSWVQRGFLAFATGNLQSTSIYPYSPESLRSLLELR